MLASVNAIVEYGEQIKQKYPQIDEEHLQKALEAKFLYGKDLLPVAGAGVICIPMKDFIAMLIILVNAWKLLRSKDRKRTAEIKKRIKDALAVLVIIN